MSFFSNLKNAFTESLPEGWITLQSAEQLEAIRSASFKKPVVVFKHSTSCGISSMAKYQLEEGWDLSQNDLDFYYLDLLRYRPVSNQVADDFGIRHQSPQILVIRNGEAVYDTSHHGVHLKGLKEVLANLN